MFDPMKSPTHKILREQMIKSKANQIRSEIVEQLDEKIQNMVDSLCSEVFDQNNEPETEEKKQAACKTRKPNGKQFTMRNSVLTELLEINHIQTIYHIFVAILVVFSLNTIVYDLIIKGRIGLDFDLILWSFDQLPVVMIGWFAMLASTSCLVYPTFSYWSYSRRSSYKVYDYAFLCLYVVYQCFFFVVPVVFVRSYNLRPASTLIVVTEQIRMIMKSHAFVRENIPKCLNYKKNDDESTLCPDFSKYLYFLFCPTLIYRDNYPRTKRVNWRYVVSNLLQVLASVFYIFYVFERFMVPVYEVFNVESYDTKRMILAAFGSMLPATLVLFITFFAILHSWLNAFAEMLRFGDRLFYKDWWNSSSFANYYRTWNLVVHDWLYTYIYNDFNKISGLTCRPLSMASVFLISAIVHEYILTMCFGFFYPVLFVMFAGAGFLFMFLTNKENPRSGNIFMWVGLFTGNGLLMFAYSREWYSRLSCPANQNAILDFVIPRSLTCDFSLINKTLNQL